ncbi:MAG: hypothetical protein NT001_04620 [Candidatus Woesearchaeota archaeon]|nr:hypothetical protein [Candidatus Woesearchaeota archaeon]
MKRKVVKQGPATFMISMPSKWVKKYNVQKGDEIDLEEDGSNLVIIRENKQRKKKAIIDLDNFNTMILNRHFAEFYRQGIEEIEIRFDKPTFPDYKNNREIEIDRYVKKTIERFIGMEIISNTKNKIIIQSFITHEKFEKIEVVQKRIYFLIKEFMEELVKAMDADFNSFNQRSYDYHDNIVKFLYYYLRLMKFSDVEEEKKERLFSLFMIIDKAIDKIRHTSEKVNEMKKITPKIKVYVQKNFLFFLDQFEMIQRADYTVKDLNLLIRKRYDIINMIKKEKFNEEEIKVIGECKFMTDTTNDFIETYAALKMEKYVSEL